MVKYLESKVKIIRRLGILPGLTNKTPIKRKKTPGQHGKIILLKQNRFSLTDDYKLCLLEKQKLKFNYGITEKQLFNYYKKAKNLKGSTGNILLQLLESRLDAIIYRLGFSSTICEARQIINHKHILINNNIVNIPSYLCTINDIITIKEKIISQNLIKKNLELELKKRELLNQSNKNIKLLESNFLNFLPNYLELNFETITGKIVSKIKRQDILLKINELKVIEYYSR